MSTKTSIKRIAAVAAVALTLGGFSAVSAHAAVVTATAATQTLGTPTRTAVDKWSVPVTFNVTSAALATGDTVAITEAATGTSNATNVVATAGVYTLTAADVVSATSAVFTTSIVFSATSGSQANVILALGTRILTPTVGGFTGIASPAITLAGNTNLVATLATTTTADTATQIAGPANFVTITNNTLLGTSPVGSVYVVISGATVYNSTATTVLLTSQAGLTPSVNVATPSAGTITVTGYAYNGANGTYATTATDKVVITVTSAPAVSAQYSTAYLAPAAVVLPVTALNANTVAASASAPAATNAGNAVANVTVSLNDQFNAPLSATGLSASITGGGTLAITPGNVVGVISQGTNLTSSAASGTGIYTVTVWASGVAGTATLTITSGTTVIGTKTLTFYAAASKAVATQNLFVANKAGGRLGLAAAGADMTLSTVAGKYAYNVVVTDANGNAAAGATVKAVSSNAAVIQSSACVQSTTTPGTYNCDVTAAAGAVSGQSADVTFEIYNAATGAYDILANPLTFKVGGVIASETLTTDSSSYSYLAPIKLSVNAKDSAGNAAYDQDQPTGLVASLVSSVALSNPAGLVSPIRLINGVGSVTGFYAPATVGDFTISAVDNVSAAGEALSVTATSVGTSSDASAQAAIDAAQEATDAANAAYDAANNAMDSADAATAAAQDASDNASAALAAVTSLSATVAKLVKSVAALATALTSIKKKLGVK